MSASAASLLGMKPGSTFGRIESADISKWARSTTGAIRPLCNDNARAKFQPVSSLASVAAFQKARLALKETPVGMVCGPAKEKSIKGVGEGDAFGDTLKIQSDYWSRLRTI